MVGTMDILDWYHDQIKVVPQTFKVQDIEGLIWFYIQGCYIDIHIYMYSFGTFYILVWYHRHITKELVSWYGGGHAIILPLHTTGMVIWIHLNHDRIIMLLLWFDNQWNWRLWHHEHHNYNNITIVVVPW